MGTDVIWLRSEDHQVQGLLQSEEYQRPCFYNGDVKAFLDNNWCPDWFYLYGLYEKWAGYYSRENIAKIPKETLSANGKANMAKMPEETLAANGKTNGPVNLAKIPKETLSANGKANMAKMPEGTLAANAATMNAHENTQKARSANGKANAATLNDHENTKKARSANGKATNSQQWQCLVTGHVSSPGSLSVYQKARGIDTSLRVKLEN
jgi:hypothetical protein